MKRAAFLSTVLALSMARGEIFAQQPATPHDHTAHSHERLGTVSFPTSCPQALRPNFNRAVALLHSFQYEDSEKAFREIAAADPACAMAYWGIAMTLYHPLWAAPSKDELNRGAAAVEKARVIGGKTERERAYIEAIGKFYDGFDKVEHRTRAVAFEEAMEQLHSKYRDDSEAAVFYALALNSTALPTDKTFVNQKKAVTILNKIFAGQPQHPGVAHYIIHNFDTPQLAELALPAARSYSKIAPDSAHALHMPSHIFTRLGMWQDSIQSNTASRDAARRYAQREHPGRTHWEELHAMDYMVYAYLQLGRDSEAASVLADLRKIDALGSLHFGAAYAFAAIPARVALERRDWAAAAALAPHPSAFPWDKFAFSEAVVHYANALGGARTNDVTRARAAIERLKQLHGKLVDAKDGYWSVQNEVLLKTASGWLALAEGRKDEALALMASAAELEDSSEKHPVTPGAIQPARELLGEMLLQTDRPAEALAAFEASLANNRDRFNGLYGAARAARIAGDGSKARRYYARLISMARGTKRMELAEAKSFLNGSAAPK
ncbi:MAG: tetratricopeptide repeat protein [Acidobacteriota bacterium]